MIVRGGEYGGGGACQLPAGGARLQGAVQEPRCRAPLAGPAAPLSLVSSPVPAYGPRHGPAGPPCWAHVRMFPVSPKQVLPGLGWGPTCVPGAGTVPSMS